MSQKIYLAREEGHTVYLFTGKPEWKANSGWEGEMLFGAALYARECQALFGVTPDERQCLEVDVAATVVAKSIILTGDEVRTLIERDGTWHWTAIRKEPKQKQSEGVHGELVP